MTSNNHPKILEIGFDSVDKLDQLVGQRGAVIVKSVSRKMFSDFINTHLEVIPQHDGNKTFDVSPEGSLAKIYRSRSKEGVPPHTDGHDLEKPPRLFLLLCCQPTRCGGGLTQISDGHQIMDHLNEKHYLTATTKEFSFSSNPSKQVMNSDGFNDVVFSPTDNQVRYSFNYLKSQDESGLVDEIRTLHEAMSMSVALEANDLLICDNYRIIHSRTSFEDDTRALVRAWASNFK